MEKDVRPLGDSIYVRRDGSWNELQQNSGLIVVEDRPDLEVGTVLAVGPGKWVTKKGREPVRVPMEVKEGDKVLFNRYAGVDYEIGLDTQHTVMKQEEVLVVLDS